MIKYCTKSCIFIGFTAICLFSCSSTGSNSDVRKPAVAGMFYPADKTELDSMIVSYLSRSPQSGLIEDIMAIIVPHAGYVYSGQIAAYAYNVVAKNRQDCKLVILIGSSHRYPIEYAAIYNKPSGWETPLGIVKVDSKVCNEIINSDSRYQCIEDAFKEEHSLEVQLPFLQKVLEDFKIVPILINNPSGELCYKLANSIISATKTKNPLIVCSTDMSHKHTYDKAVKMDMEAVNLLKTIDIKGLSSKLSDGSIELCGSAAVITAMYLATVLESQEPVFLKYANSGDVTGDRSSVVGYSSFYIAGGKKHDDIKSREDTGMLDKKQQATLLTIARETIKTYILENKLPEYDINDPVLREKRGVFVTLHKYGNLRGCIGYIMPVDELYSAVMKMAIESSTRDSRFRSVTASELKEIEIEISVLSVPEKVTDVNDIVMGRHGVIVKKGFNQGVFLPQVATETGWSREEFLSRLCADKAGLSETAWKDKNIEIYTFTAQVFNEKQEGR